MVRCVLATLGVLVLALRQCLSQNTACSGDLTFLNDGYCDSETNNLACGYDGGDCCACTCVDRPIYDCGSNGFNCMDPACPDEDPSLYPNCTGDIEDLHDGTCDPETNTLGCSYDGGDCCECTCVDGFFYSCGSTGFSCADPACLDPTIAMQYPECEGKWLSIGDGVCTPENNNLSCGYDGGDCCLCTCSGRACIYSEFDCLDPSAGDEIYDCKPPPSTSVPCPVDGQRVWVVEDSSQARALAEAVNCSGGSFEVLWRGEVVVDQTIYVFDGTVLNVTGDGSIAGMNGDSGSRLLTVVNAAVHVTGVNMSYGAGTVGGAIAAVRSSLTFNGSTFFGNAATGHGGAVYASDSSVVSFVGQNTFSDNIAAMHGGAVFVLDSACTGESVTFFNNTAGGDGGAMMITEHSSSSWSGKAMYLRNRAMGNAGALALQRSASASWHGETSFDNNSARQYAGALHVLGASYVEWDATTIFSNNTAGFTGGAMRVTNSSGASWGGSTRYVGNAGLSGGAMMISGGSAAFSGGNTAFSANTAETLGGAVFVSEYSNVVLSVETMFSGNVAQQGGAVFVSDHAIVALSGETMLSRNSAEDAGAVFVQSNAYLSFDGMTTFHRNMAVGVDVSDIPRSGGALGAVGSTVRLSGNTTFSDNTAETQGGAVYASDSAIVTWDGNTTFSSNVAGRGGAVYAQSSSNLSFDGSTTFHGNVALGVNRSDVSPAGGGLAMVASTVTLSGETMFAENQALGSGGAVMLVSTIAVWTGRSSFLNNLVRQSGGGLFLFDANVFFHGSTTFQSNIAYGGGAVHAGGHSSVSWDGGMEFVNNSANSGGALSVINSNVSWSGKATLENNRASGNESLAGGALWILNGARVSWSGESMFNNNSAPGFGGAAYVSWDSSITWSGDTTFQSCAASFGGALHVQNGSAVEWSGRTVFSSNNAVFFGGAIGSFFLDEASNPRSSTLVINGPTTFTNNRAGSTGGGLALNGMLSVEFQSSDVLFIGNSAEVVGGAVFVSSFGVGPVFSAVRFVDNFAGAGGGAYVTGSGNENLNEFEVTPVYATKFDGCQFVNNRATATGGAIESVAGQDHISNTAFVGNTAAVGGALRLGGKTFLDNCSFVDNRSGEGAGPAVDNIGFVGRITDSSFTGNVFDCQSGTYLDSNQSGNAYEVACNGCRTACQGCPLEESVDSPICVQLMEHATSFGGATTLETISIDRGFWRATSTSMEILACYRDDTCLGGVTGTPGYCLVGYEGPYCSICSDGYAASFGLACEKCSNKAGGIVLTVVLAVLVVVVAAATASYTMSSQLEGNGRGTIGRVTRFIPLQSIKIVIVALQIVTQFAAIANVTYPHVYQRFLDTVNVLNFDIGWISQLSVGCLVDIGIHGRLLIATIGPIIAVLFLGLTYVVAAKVVRGSAEALHLIRHKHMSMMLLLTFLVYSSVSSILFRMFACDDLEGSKKYLRADYRVECDSSKHKAFQVYAGFMVLLYTVGIPALYTSLLFRDREVLNNEVGRDESERIRSFSDLWKPYKPSVFYYEVIECGRRVLLTGTVVFIYPNTSAQIAVTLMIAFVFAMISEGLAPFASRWDTWISRMGHVVVYVSMYVALLLKVDVSNERSSSQEVFEGVLVAAHLGMVLTVIVETGVMVCSLRETVREGTWPRFRGTA